MGIRRNWVGGPGAGKTYKLQEEIGWLLEDGVPGERIYATSYSVAAAQVLKARAGDELPKENIGTLHSAGYRKISGHVLGGKKMGGKKDATDEWNEQYPRWAIRRDGYSSDPYDALGDGERMLAASSKLRHLLKPEDDWAARLWDWSVADKEDFFRFWEAWKRFKRLEGVVDFEDMIEMPLREGWLPPNGCTHLVVDEWQDLTPLERQLVFNWFIRGELELLVTGGDPYQSINGYRGADPLFEMPENEMQMRYLLHSNRMPSAVVDWSEAWIRQWGERPERKPMEPVREGGQVVRRPEWTLKNAEHWLDQVENEGSVVLLASTNFLINRLVPVLRAKGIRFANPHRPAQGNWNPIEMKNATSMVSRVLAWHRFFVEGERTVGNLRKVSGLFKTKGIVGNQVAMDKALAQMPAEARLDDEWMAEHWLDEAAVGTMERLMPLGSSERAVAAMKYVEAMLGRGGADYARGEPRVHIGTVHSYKGHEADTVVVFPDVSKAAAKEAEFGSSELLRVFYVAGTRAKDTLVLAGSENKYRMWR